MQHPAGELQILPGREGQQVPQQPEVAGTHLGAGLQHLPDVQQQHLCVLGGGDVDHQRLTRYAGIRLRKDAARAHAAKNAVVAPYVPHLDDDPAGQHHAQLLRGRPLRQDDRALFIAALCGTQAAQHFLDVRRRHAAKKRGIPQIDPHIFLLFVGVPTDFHKL